MSVVCLKILFFIIGYVWLFLLCLTIVQPVDGSHLPNTFLLSQISPSEPGDSLFINIFQLNPTVDLDDIIEMAGQGIPSMSLFAKLTTSMASYNQYYPIQTWVNRIGVTGSVFSFLDSSLDYIQYDGDMQYIYTPGTETVAGFYFQSQQFFTYTETYSIGFLGFFAQIIVASGSAFSVMNASAFIGRLLVQKRRRSALAKLAHKDDDRKDGDLEMALLTGKQ